MLCCIYTLTLVSKTHSCHFSPRENRLSAAAKDRKTSFRYATVSSRKAAMRLAWRHFWKESRPGNIYICISSIVCSAFYSRPRVTSWLTDAYLITPLGHLEFSKIYIYTRSPRGRNFDSSSALLLPEKFA